MCAWVERKVKKKKQQTPNNLKKKEFCISYAYFYFVSHSVSPVSVWK